MIASNSIRWLLNDCCLYRTSSSGKLKLNITELVGNLAYHAMMLEAHLTPKAGLVDCASSGAHRDMDIGTFIASSDALRPYMKKFVSVGMEFHHSSPTDLLLPLREVGIQAEHAMFTATNNVNTHKGMIFTLGLICGAVGWLHQRNVPSNASQVREVIRSCCATIVRDDLEKQTGNLRTAGERIFHDYGFTGIRGEAALGYPTIFDCALPVYEEHINKAYSEEQALSKTLLSLMANNNDTNLINRGGIEGLNFVKKEAQKLLDSFACSEFNYDVSISNFDQQLIAKNLSPGGSADLLAATWLLAQLNICSN
ncbi:triphosphoribosyl-dephospho-CoA synthase CitG [Vibrio sp. 99-8-1]|uniref:triphosphoribosyl-dephospho-CoA synthase CitG n=1 Tax=Vibrio sp. 99-8-1 TaxID=2607602 RepID=UPI00149393F7|nr:triphosphoribosyl-dephospho-CoA synthase CitG [Vibrio sp. 99-8-1]NOI67136.1 triphosphoribosyl-dephospho-CoA synthase CitG [Vibrio sp. 99-8-1]